MRLRYKRRHTKKRGGFRYGSTHTEGQIVISRTPTHKKHKTRRIHKY